MIKMSDTRGFSLIEAVVAIAVLGVGIVSVFTIYHTVIIGQRVSEGILEQSLNINGIVNEIRTGIPAGRTDRALYHVDGAGAACDLSSIRRGDSWKNHR